MKKLRIIFMLTALAVMIIAGCGSPASQEIDIVTATEESAEEPTVEPTQQDNAEPTLEVTEEPTPEMTEESTSEVTEEPTPEPALEPLAVDERTLVYTNDYIEVDISCPEISGMQDTLVQGNINDEVYAFLEGLAQTTEQLSIDDEADFGEHGIYYAGGEYEVMRNDGNILSIKITSSMYTGGAHPNSSLATINVINTDPSSQPTFEELFLPDTDYITEFNDRINAEIAADPSGADAFWFETVTSNQMYYLTDTALVVLFDAYEIAPYAYGPAEFEFSFAELSDMLVSEIQ